MRAADLKALENLAASARRLPAPHPGLAVADLSSRLQGRVGAHVLGLIEARDRAMGHATDAECYMAALDHFGLACPHSMRTSATWGFKCNVCGAYVVKASL
mgnify:CR=1 FL=1